MAKIPLYNQGKGLGQQTPVGKLSRAPNVGALTAPAKAMGDLAQTVGQIAFNFGMAERDREDKRIIDEEYNTASEKLMEHKFQDKSTTVEQSKENFKSIENKIRNKFKGKKYGSRREQLISQNLSKLINSQKFGVMQDAFDRGQNAAATNSDMITEKGLSELRGLSPDDPMFGIRRELLLSGTKRSRELDLPTKFNIFNLTKSIDDIAANNTREGFTNKITKEKSKQNLSVISKNLEENKILSAPAKDVIRNQIKNREIEIDTETVADFGNFIPAEEVEKTTFGTVDGINDTIFQLEKNGNISDPLLKVKWDKADGTLRKRILAEMRNKARQARDNITYETNKGKLEQEENNNNLLDFSFDKIQKNDMTIKEVRELGWKGVNGIKIRDALISQIVDQISGKQKTDSSPKTYQGINEAIERGQINDVFTEFTIQGDVKPQSLLQRMNKTISQEDYKHFRALLIAKQKQPTDIRSKETLEGIKRFEEFLKANKSKVQGVYASLDPDADKTFYDFSVQMRRRFMDGMEDYFKRKDSGQLKEGELLLDLIDERKTDKYILQDPTGYFTTPQKNLENFSNSLKKEQLTSNSSINPPIKPPGMTIEQYYQSEEFKEFETSGKFKLWKEQQNAGNN